MNKILPQGETPNFLKKGFNIKHILNDYTLLAETNFTILNVQRNVLFLNAHIYISQCFNIRPFLLSLVFYKISMEE